MVPPSHRALHAVLESSRQLGFLGPGPVDEHLQHARIFLAPLEGVQSCVDLGSGGGVPGLALACWRPDLHLTLVDAATKRCDFLSEAVERLDLADRVEVRCGRAEEIARDPALRGAFPAVVARSFGRPAVTAECAVGFLGGEHARLIVSEPPQTDPTRWPDEGLALLGLRRGPRQSAAGATVQILELTEPVDPRWPRRIGVPAKRPLF